MRALKVEIERMPLELHLPYWLAFLRQQRYGKVPRSWTRYARRIEGAKSLPLFLRNGSPHNHLAVRVAWSSRRILVEDSATNLRRKAIPHVTACKIDRNRPAGLRVLHHQRSRVRLATYRERPARRKTQRRSSNLSRVPQKLRITAFSRRCDSRPASHPKVSFSEKTLPGP